VFASLLQRDNRVRVTFDGVPQNDTDYNTYITELDRIYTEKKQFVILFDARKIGAVSMSYIKQQAEYMHQRREDTVKYMNRVAVVVSSPMASAMLKTLFLIRPPAVKVKIFYDINKAKTYLRLCDYHRDN